VGLEQSQRPLVGRRWSYRARRIDEV
jgi:hypothetical protein